jgi:prephenate dehydratase
MISKIGFLGPRGTFTEAALRELEISESSDLIAFATVTLALDAVRNGEIDAALVPLENSV